MIDCTPELLSSGQRVASCRCRVIKMTHTTQIRPELAACRNGHYNYSTVGLLNVLFTVKVCHINIV